MSKCIQNPILKNPGVCGMGFVDAQKMCTSPKNKNGSHVQENMSLQASAPTTLSGDTAGSTDGVALQANQSTSIGYNAAPNSLGQWNTYTGYNVARFSKTGSYNVVVGAECALLLNTSYNCILGYGATRNFSTGNGGNTVYGALAAPSLYTGGGSNTIVGFAANAADGTGNSTVIGANATATATNALAVGAVATAGADAIAIGMGANASGRNSLAIGTGVSTYTEGSIDIMGRIKGLVIPGNKYELCLKSDITRLSGGALGFASSSNVDKTVWCAFTSPSSLSTTKTDDLVFMSANGVATRLSDTFRAGVLNFTGQHRCLFDELYEHLQVGMIAVSTGRYCDLSGSDEVHIDEALPILKVCNKPYDPSVFGVVSFVEGESDEMHVFQVGTMVAHVAAVDRRVSVNSVGEGCVLVCNEGGHLKNGDLIVSSSRPGIGMRARDDVIRSSTVAKITCNCIFSRDEIKLVGCIYRM